MIAGSFGRIAHESARDHGQQAVLASNGVDPRRTSPVGSTLLLVSGTRRGGLGILLGAFLARLRGPSALRGPSGCAPVRLSAEATSDAIARGPGMGIL